MDHNPEDTLKHIERTKANAMRKLKYLLIVLFMLAIPGILYAEDGNGTSVGQFMRSNERAYVVIAVMVTILLGLILYLVRLDRKISRLEKEK
jgi:hypothetical protein